MEIINKIIEFFKSLFNKKDDEVAVAEILTPTVVVEEEEKIIENKEENIMSEINESAAIFETSTKKQYKGLAVALDPGHAITTPGKKSPYSLKKVTSPELPFEEWEFNREITYLVKNMLKELGVEVFVTTTAEMDGDTDLGLSKRATRANDFIKKCGKKGLFLSIHSDADGMGNTWTKARGWSCYTTKGQNNSDRFADCLYDAAEEILPNMGMKIRTDKKDGDRDWEEDFTVIYKANMPAVLTENCFYTNIDDVKFLISDEGKEAIARIHVNGILKFAEQFYKM